jgi:copper chaperone CopZ
MKTLLSIFLMALLAFPEGYAGEKEKLKLQVDGMHCPSCASMIKKSVRKVSGVESISVDLKSGVVEVECDSAAERSGLITTAIRKMGYTVTNTDSASHDPKSNKIERKQ